MSPPTSYYSMSLTIISLPVSRSSASVRRRSVLSVPLPVLASRAQIEQQPGKPDRLFAEFVPDVKVSVLGRIPLQQIDHCRHRVEAPGPFLKGWRIQASGGRGRLPFCMGDALFHCFGPDHQRKSQLIGDRQFLVAAHEHEAQDIVPQPGKVDFLGQAGFAVFGVASCRVVARMVLETLLPAQPVDGRVAPGHYQPGDPIPWMSMFGPVFQRPDG